MNKEYLKHPVRIVTTKLLSMFFPTAPYRWLVRKHPRIAIDLQWLSSYGKLMNWKRPTTIDEKIQWLQVYGDTSLWTRLSDKYDVKGYIAEKGHEDIIIKTYGVLERVEDIDYDKLPDKFVIKCTHDSGSTHIVKRKSDLNIEELNRALNKSLHSTICYDTCEIHYTRLKPRIIAEELLENTSDSGESKSLIDYKVWCAHGKPLMVLVCYDREFLEVGHGHVSFDTYFVHPWRRWEQGLTLPYRHADTSPLPEPKNLERMLQIASNLSADFPEVRVDFYNIAGRIYFGEMTFTSCCGRHDYLSEEAKIMLGKEVRLKR